MRRATEVVATVLCASVLAGISPARASPTPLTLTLTQVVLKGSSNSILGSYALAGLGFALSADTILTFGATFTERFGLEPLLAVAQTRTLGSNWTLNWTVSRGDLGGDYRVDRLPEITFTRDGTVGGPVAYHLEAGVGYFAVRSSGGSGLRGLLGAQLATSSIPIGSLLAVNGNVGYRQYLYSDGTLHSGWWRSFQLTVAPEASLSTAFTYYRQDVSGTSPLLFDAMSPDHYVAGAATLRIGQAVTLQHNQTYSLISQTISARVYSITVQLPRGPSANISWDDVPQKLSVSYSWSNVAFTVGWEVPTQRLSIAYQQ